MYLVRTGAITGFETFVYELGGNPVELIHQVGLKPAQFRDPNTYISYGKMIQLLESASEGCGHKQFGLLLAQRQDANVFGGLALSISQEPTVAAAISKFNRYLYLHATGVSLNLNPAGKDIQFGIEFLVSSAYGFNQLSQLSVGQMANFLSKMVGFDRYDFDIHLRQRDPDPTGSPKSGFRSCITYSSGFNGILLKKSFFEQKPRFDEVALQSHFSGYLQYLQKHYAGDLQNQVKDIIGQLLPSGECSIETVAETLSLSARVLQKKLKREGVSYRELLEGNAPDGSRAVSQERISIHYRAGTESWVRRCFHILPIL
ncbi:MAG: AraC family transcriptional regulator ligand-binding domain-containing protein [Porticoccaceae bacterium]